MDPDPHARMMKLASRAWGEEALRRANTAIVPLNDLGQKPPIVSFHAVDAKATPPINLAKLLGPDQPYYAVRVPNNRRTPEFANSIPEIAAFYLDELLTYRFRRVVLMGWSLGAIIAYEVASQLEQIKRTNNILVPEVLAVIAIDHAPESVSISPFVWIRKEWRKSRSVRQLAGRTIDKVLSMPRSGIALRNRISRRQIEETFRRDFKPTETELKFYMALYDAAIRYRPPGYKGRVVLFAATNDKNERQDGWDLHVEQLEAKWATLARNFKVVPYAGNHRTFMGQDVASLTPLATNLRFELTKLEAVPNSPEDDF
ncbi:MAG TPA: alpha/beta fold hydrolase [Candidatus Sulfotelmatobacter sp.]|nr:alpha/beta fold hydrolase [Candidatus Sulfotelmatobacter sp.]